MSRCEFHEIAVSALIDGALEKSELLPTLDHLLACPSCRQFYGEARALGTLLAPAGSQREPQENGLAEEAPAAETPPEEIWQRIAAESSRPRLPAWALRAAAAVLLVVGGLWIFAVQTGRGPASFATAAPREVVLGEGTGMSEARFVALTTEVLAAEPRYRREMLRVMREVADESGRAEAPTEDGIRTEDLGSPRGEGRGGRV